MTTTTNYQLSQWDGGDRITHAQFNSDNAKIDDALDAQLAKRSDVLWRTENGRHSLALPWESGQPFPLTELFCFARVQTVQGKQCVVYRVGADGLPLLEE